MTILFDAHCHLAPDFSEIPQREIPLQTEQSCAGRLVCGVDPGDWPGVLALSKYWRGTTVAFGLHPWYVPDNASSVSGDTENNSGWLAELEQYLTDTCEAWLGEAGLDARRRGIAPEAVQENVFGEQLALAARLGRRANIHCVGAWDALLRLLDQHYLGTLPGRGFIVHGFGGPYQMIAPLAERGAFFTVGPLLSHKDTRKSRERAALFPLERILFESDAYLRPGVDARETLEGAVEWLAGVLSMPVGELADQVYRNTREIVSDE